MGHCRSICLKLNSLADSSVNTDGKINVVYPNWLSLDYGMLIGVGPETPGAVWLRDLAIGLTERKDVNQEFPINSKSSVN